MTVLTDSFRVAWIDFMFIKRNILVVLVTCLVTPLLYIVAFGYGFGAGAKMEGFDYIAFMIPGVISMSTMTSCFNNVATKVMIQRTYYQSFDELFLCSMKPTAIILGKAWAGMVRSIISCSILYSIGLAITPDMHLTAQAIAIILMCCLTYALLGVVAGMLSNSHLTMTLFTTVVITPMSFLSGTIFSMDALPEAAQYVLYALPLTHSTDCIRSTILETDFPWISLAIMVIYAVAFILISRHVVVKGRH
ncbi:MAG: ABC transporter permease [Candidatus Methanomethylophilaceae archaeon]|nr:ABC transporter permease [Candidatus Methanomethylophilaceae archaeon]